MKKEDVWLGARVITSNSIELYKSSRTLAENKHFGAAVSLLILSSEEAIKALAYAYAAISDSEIDDLEQDFKKHKIKHVYGIFICSLTEIMPKILERAALMEEDDSIPDFLKKIRLTNYAKNISEKHTNEKIDAWYESANQLKNSGLYVDYVDGAWRSPKDISESEYMKNKEVCEYFLNIAYKTVAGCDLNTLIAIRRSVFDK